MLANQPTLQTYCFRIKQDASALIACAGRDDALPLAMLVTALLRGGPPPRPEAAEQAAGSGLAIPSGLMRQTATSR